MLDKHMLRHAALLQFKFDAVLHNATQEQVFEVRLIIGSQQTPSLLS